MPKNFAKSVQRIPPFRPGIDILLARHKKLLQGKQVGLISHSAAVDSQGCTSAQRLWDNPDINLACLMGPEHGYFGREAAGKTCRASRHPDWKIPIHSLYGSQRCPPARVLKHLDAIIFDLQDLGTRAYTYVSTLQLTMQAAAESGTRLIVTDRPIPLPLTTDGPMLNDDFASFVAAIPAPLAYGMTPGETALWLQATQIPNCKLQVIPMQGYQRNAPAQRCWPPWMRPSPSIVSLESAACFPATVAFEGLPAIDHGRATDMPFQLIGAPFTNGPQLTQALNEQNLPGISFYPHHYRSLRADYHPTKTISGIRLTVTNPIRFRPALTGITIIHTLQELYGLKRIWPTRNTRPEFFDKLMGTDTVRVALLAGHTPREIADIWQPDLRIFRRERAPHLLYGET